MKCVFISIVSILFFCTGCNSTRETEKPVQQQMTRKNFLAKYEKTFDPTEYEIDVAIIQEEEKKLHDNLEGPSLLVTAVPETIPGFRVQVLLTQDIDEANSIKDSVENGLSGEWVYLTYDSPYYKVRVGNFPNRLAATIILKKLVTEGYKDAWIVPDNVLKNPPPKPPDVQIEPEKPLDQHR